MCCRVGDDIDGLCWMVPGHASRDGGLVQEVAEPERVPIESVCMITNDSVWSNLHLGDALAADGLAGACS